MTNENHADHVEQALRSFRDDIRPEEPPTELVNATLERLQAMNRAAEIPMRSNENRLRQFRSRVAITAGTLLVAIVAWVGLTGLPGAIALADVQLQLERAKTVRYVEIRLLELGGENLKILREMTRGKNDLGPGERRVNLGDACQPRIITIRGPHLQRTEILAPDSTIESIQISDMKAGKHVILSPNEKKLVELASQVTIDFDSGKTSEEAIGPTPDVDLIASIRDIPADATTRLPERTIEGKPVVGFFSRQTIATTQGTDTWERTYWVDPGTKLPVRVEVSHYSTDPRSARSDWVLSGFVFDEDVPESEFSLELPPGYTRETAKIYGIKVE
jgi:hypothetical protein